jgi:hypothetical protein
MKQPIVGADLGLSVPVGTPCKVVVWSLGSRLTVRGLVTHHYELPASYRVLVADVVGDDGKPWHIHARTLRVPAAAVAGDDGK